jgi:predicted GH43/DUF377 family glycosyl hydrolase
VIMKPVAYHWDEMKIGPGAPPFKTDKGWLHIYHGVFKTMSGTVYRLGAALHDLDDPAKIIGVSDQWILQPEDPWEVNRLCAQCGLYLRRCSGRRRYGKNILGRRGYGHVRRHGRH